MSEKQKTYHLMILDKSGSMGTVRDVTISGLNEQLQSIRKAEEDFEDQEQIVCFVTFNAQVDSELLWNEKISGIIDFDKSSYSPLGGTALYDAIGMGIGKLRSEIEEELSGRKANVVVTIFTDGDENSSVEHNGTQIKELVDSIQETGQWTVAFVGCGDNVFEVSNSMGIARGNTMSYASGIEGTTRAFTSMSNARYMRSQSYSTANEKGLKTDDINCKVNFFDNIDLDEDTDQEQKKEDDKN